MKEARMKIVVDRIPQSSEECFLPIVLHQNALRAGALLGILIGLRSCVGSASGKSVRISQK